MGMCFRKRSGEGVCRVPVTEDGTSGEGPLEVAHWVRNVVVTQKAELVGTVCAGHEVAVSGAGAGDGAVWTGGGVVSWVRRSGTTRFHRVWERISVREREEGEELKEGVCCDIARLVLILSCGC
jgi:hypothetical protein